MGGKLEFSEKLETRGSVSGQSVDHSADERGNGGETVSLLTCFSALRSARWIPRSSYTMSSSSLGLQRSFFALSVSCLGSICSKTEIWNWVTGGEYLPSPNPKFLSYYGAEHITFFENRFFFFI